MFVTLKEVLAKANSNHFAVPAFNVSSSMLLRAVIEASEENSSPVIIAIHPNELKFVRDSFVDAVRNEAERTRVPVCIHLDHGSTFEQCMHAISCGFSSVMIDASTLSFEENIATTVKVTEAAHAAGVSVEAEIGTIGATGNGGEAGTDNIIYSDPNDVKTFIDATGIDALAIAIGTAHGIYPKGKQPKLRMDILQEIRRLTDLPLVLHGGSDNPDSEISEAVKLGVSKVNISSDIKRAFYIKCREILTDNTLREPCDIYPECIEATKLVCNHKIKLFGADGKAELYR